MPMREIVFPCRWYAPLWGIALFALSACSKGNLATYWPAAPTGQVGVGTSPVSAGPVSVSPGSPSSAALTVNSVQPSSGNAHGGITLDIKGDGFVAGSTEVHLGKKACLNVQVLSPTELKCVTDSDIPGNNDVSVTTVVNGQNTTALKPKGFVSQSFLFAPDAAGPLTAYTIGVDGSLSAINLGSAISSTIAVAVSPNGKFLYALTASTVSSYAINQVTGDLVATGETVPLPTSPTVKYVDLAAASLTTGSYLYVTTEHTVERQVFGNLQVYLIDPGMGKLTDVGLFDAGDSPKTAALLPTGHAFFADVDSTLYSLDPKQQGKPTVATGLKSLNPQAAAVLPSGAFYVTFLGSQVGAYALDKSGTKVVGSALTVLGHAFTGVAAAPSGSCVYAANHLFSGTLDAFAVQTDGTLSNKGSVAAGKLPNWVTIEPRGNFAYVTSDQDGTIASYALMPNCTPPAAGTPVIAGLSRPGRLIIY